MTDPIQDPNNPRPGQDAPDHEEERRNPGQTPPLDDVPLGGGGDDIGRERVPERSGDQA